MPTIAALRRELIDKRGWLTNTQFALSYALSRVCPGTNLLGFCTAVGWQARGIGGAVVALFASSFPCAVFAVLLSLAFELGRGSRLVDVAIEGASAAAVGIVAGSCWQLVQPSCRVGNRLRVIVLTAGGACLQVVGVAPLRVLAIAAVIGLIWRDKS